MNLSEIEKALEAATPGEWEAVEPASGEQGYAWVEVQNQATIGDDMSIENARAIALLRNETPKLIAALRAVEKLAAHWNKQSVEMWHKVAPNCVEDQLLADQFTRMSERLNQALAEVAAHLEELADDPTLLLPDRSYPRGGADLLRAAAESVRALGERP